MRASIWIELRANRLQNHAQSVYTQQGGYGPSPLSGTSRGYYEQRALVQLLDLVLNVDTVKEAP